MKTKSFYVQGLLWGFFLLASTLALTAGFLFRPGLRLWMLGFAGVGAVVYLSARTIADQLRYRREDRQREADIHVPRVFR